MRQELTRIVEMRIVVSYLGEKGNMDGGKCILGAYR